MLPAGHGLYIGHSPNPDLSPACPVSVFNSFSPKNLSAGRKIRPFDNIDNLINLRIPIFQNPVVNELDDSVYDFLKVMGRDIGRHTHGDSLSSVHQEIGESGRKNSGLLFCVVKVWNKIDSILSDVRQHFHGNLAQTCFRVTHGRRTVSVHGTEIPMAIHKRIPGGPFLSHIDQSPINRAVSVGMIFSHGVTDNTGTFSVGLVRTVVELDHRIENPPLYRL